MEQRFTPSQSAEMTKRKLPPGVTIGDVNEAGGNPMQRMPRNPRMDSADVPRRPAQAPMRRGPESQAMGIPLDVARQTAIEARKMREEAGDEAKTITIKYKDGGYVCPPNQRTGNIDMRKTGMTRSVKDNRKKG